MDYGADTIAALGTAAAPAALAIVRVSGPRAIQIVDEMVEQRNRSSLSAWRAGCQRHARLLDENGEFLDEVMISIHRAPRSFTGEDTVEITCHGGPLVSGLILARLHALGARPAEPGEFTRRSFLNGKMELTRAEAVMDIINAQTRLALRAAARQLEGRIGQRVAEIQDSLLTVLAHVEAHIDFPEEDISPATVQSLTKEICVLVRRCEELIGTEFQGRVLRDGLRVVIAGPPNAGKSSLLNKLLGFDRAIVSAIPGTTRDFIEETMSIRGVPVRLMDTAGIRDTADAIEAEGVARARKAVGDADVALLVVDGSLPRRAGDLPEESTAPRHIRVINKIDLGVHPSWADEEQSVRVSCLSGQGIERLADEVAALAMGDHGWIEPGAAVNARHADALRRAAEALGQASNALAGGMEPEFVALDLRVALSALGEILGQVDTEDVLGRIFATFCIGK